MKAEMLLYVNYVTVNLLEGLRKERKLYTHTHTHTHTQKLFKGRVTKWVQDFSSVTKVIDWGRWYEACRRNAERGK